MPESEKARQNPVFYGKVIKVRQDLLRTPDGQEKVWDVVEYPQAVAVVTVDAAGRLLLVQQYRHPVENTLLEIPAGGMEAGESPEAAVVRELREETGFRPNRITRLTSFYSAPGYSTELLHLFLAEDLVPDRLTAEDTDEITVVETTTGEAMKMLEDGRIRDGKTIAGLLFYLQFKQFRDAGLSPLSAE